MQESTRIIRFASYNIRKSVGLDWKRNGGRILDVLAEIKADVIALQEADKRFGQRDGTLPVKALERELGYRFASLGGNANSHGWHGNAILYRPSLTLLAASHIKIPTLEPRGAVAARFCSDHIPEFQFIGTHLSLFGAMRAKQVRMLSEHALECGHSLPTVIAGDFNEWKQNGKAVRAMTGGFQIITPGVSFHSAHPRLSLDRFMLSHGLQMKDCGVHHSPTAKIASDHLPIYMDVNICVDSVDGTES